MISLNIQSVLSKKEEAFWETIDFYQPDFIVGCETWLNHTVFDEEVFPENYKVYHKDRADGYGGVLVGIKKKFSSEFINISTDTELCAVKIKKPTSSDTLILISVYRPPNRDTYYHQSLCNAIHNIVIEHPKSAIYYAGDLNLPDIYWNSESISNHR